MYDVYKRKNAVAYKCTKAARTHTHTGGRRFEQHATERARLFQIKELKCNLPNRTQKERPTRLAGAELFKICLCALARSRRRRLLDGSRRQFDSRAALILVSQSLLISREREHFLDAFSACPLGTRGKMN